MRNTILYIAMSLDGYIADPAGNVDWLTGHDPDAPSEDGYGTFVQGIDTVIMGWNTYHQIVTELSPEQWVYEGLQSYVITHRDCGSREGITFTHQSPTHLIRSLRQAPVKDIWICGGAAVIHPLMQEDLIDTYHISIIPTILGGGIPLFANLQQKLDLHLDACTSCNGITELSYRRRCR